MPWWWRLLVSSDSRAMCSYRPLDAMALGLVSPVLVEVLALKLTPGPVLVSVLVV